MPEGAPCCPKAIVEVSNVSDAQFRAASRLSIKQVTQRRYTRRTWGPWPRDGVAVLEPLQLVGQTRTISGEKEVM